MVSFIIVRLVILYRILMLMNADMIAESGDEYAKLMTRLLSEMQE